MHTICELSHANCHSGNLDAAIDNYSRAIELKPDFADAWANRGVAQAKLGEFEAAIYDCNRAIELKPDLADAWASRGAAQAGLGENEAAIDDFDKALELARQQGNEALASHLESASTDLQNQ